MKLSNAQLDSLATKIAKDINNERLQKKEQKMQDWQLQNKELVQQTLDAYSVVFDALDSKLVESIILNKGFRTISSSEKLREVVLYNLVKEHIDLEQYSKRVVHFEVKQELILGTIECENLQEIIDHVKAKF